MERTIEEKIVQKCIEQGAHVATAESCTGGLTAAAIVNVAGASAAFCEGYITYSNEAKERILGVSAKTLNMHGAVSSETAAEMAAGCAKKAGSDYAVTTTGIAGPDGGTPEKPVGLVYIGCYAQGETDTIRCMFDGTRAQIRQAAAKRALEFLYEHM